MIRTPIERVYRYENVRDWRALYLWLPRGLLDELVQAGADPRLLRDFPRGLEIEVHAETFAEYAAAYGLVFKVPAPWLERAFEVILGHFKRVPLAGYLEAAFFESLAIAIEESVPPQRPLRTRGEIPRRRLDRARTRQRRALKRALQADPVQAALGAPRGTDWLRTPYGEVPMSAGDPGLVGMVRVATERRRPLPRRAPQ